MKKLFYSVLAASMLFATSCSHEEIVDITKGEGQKVTFKVNLPDQSASRAVADGSKADRLIYAMYETGTTKDATEALISGVVDDRDSNGNFTVTVPMAKDIEYDLLFLAYDKDCCAFEIATVPETTDLRSLKFQSNLEGNQDAYDAFVGALFNNGISSEKTISLARPFAQVNAATSDEDWENAELLNSAITNSVFTIQGVPSIYNVFEEKASGSMNVSFKPAAPLSEELEGYQNYKYLTLAYVLAGDNTTQSTATANFIFYRKDNKQVSSLAIPNFPLERNHRTNVLGSLLTAVEEYTVTINPILEEDEYTPESDNVPSVKDVQTSEDWAEVAALLDQPSEEPISIKLGGINGRSADDKVIVANEPATIHTDNTVILDLNGWTLKYENEQTSAFSMITNNGNLTIIDNIGGGKISYTDKGEGGEYVSNTITNCGTLTIESGIVENMSSATVGQNGYPYVIDNNSTSHNATLNVKGGKLYSEGYSAIRAYANSTVNDNVVNVESGEIVGTIEFQSPNVNANKASLNISGGKISNKATDNALFIFGKNGDASQMNINITGGEFTGVIKASQSMLIGENFNSKFITGGTFSTDPSDFVDDGFVAIYEDEVWTVKAKEIVAKIGDVGYTSLEDAIAAVESNVAMTRIDLVPGEYTLPNVQNKNITLRGQGYETVVDYSSMGDYQEVSGSSFAFENLTVKNAETGYPYPGLQHITSVSYTDCNILGTVNLFATAIFKNCELDSGNAEHNVVTYGSDNVTFENCKFTYADRAVNCYAESASTRDVAVTFTGCTFTKEEGNETTGAIETNSSLMNSLTLTINDCTVNEGYLWWISGWDSKGGANTSVTLNGEKTEGVVLVQSSVLPYLTIYSNSTYKLVGGFASANVSLVMAEGIENVVFDGTNATNINELIITQNGALIDNATTAEGERSGNVTIQNFNVLSQINVFACKTEVVVQKNTAEALMVYAGNCDVKVLNNTIDANFESHSTYRDATTTWNTNDYGIALNIFNYNLWLDGNTVTDATSHAIGINGWEGTIDTNDYENEIKSFTGNTITVNSTTNTKRAAFKVWDDETYASNDDDTNVVNATAQAFIDEVLALEGENKNTFNILEGYDHTIFCIYNVNTND